MELNIIAAVAANRAIWISNDMVYFISEDLNVLATYNGTYRYHGA